MTYQSGQDIAVNYKLESAFGVLPGATGGTALRVNTGSNGLSLSRAQITSNENRRDGMTTRGRNGSKSVSGSYAADLSLGSLDALIEAVLRGTFDVALVITEATGSLASVTTTTNTIVAGGGSWITAGLRVGDVIRLTNFADAANNGKNLLIVGLTASTITVEGDSPLVTNSTPDTAFTITRPRKVIMGKVARSFTFEEQETGIDGSEVFTGCRVSQMQIQLSPDGMCVLTFSIVGRDMQALEGASSPYFTAPAATVSVGMTSVEAGILIGADRIMDVTSVDLTVDLRASGTPVVASLVSPEIFTNNALLTGTLSTLRQDLSRVQDALDETQVSLHLLFVENESEPKDFCSFFLGNVTLAMPSKSAIGQDNGRTQQIALNIGADDRGGAYDPTMIKFQTSTVAV